MSSSCQQIPALLLSYLFIFGILSMTNCSDDSSVDVRSQSCPNGWVTYKYTKCVKFFPQSLNQTEAQKSCQLVKADLVSIQNSDENIDFLLAYMRKETATTTLPAAAWLGGMRIKSHWFWVDLSWFNAATYNFDDSNSYHFAPEHSSWSVACMVLKSEPEVQQVFGPSGAPITGNGIVRYKLSIRKCEDTNSYFCQKELKIRAVRLLSNDIQDECSGQIDTSGDGGMENSRPGFKPKGRLLRKLGLGTNVGYTWCPMPHGYVRFAGREGGNFKHAAGARENESKQKAPPVIEQKLETLKLNTLFNEVFARTFNRGFLGILIIGLTGTAYCAVRLYKKLDMVTYSMFPSVAVLGMVLVMAPMGMMGRVYDNSDQLINSSYKKMFDSTNETISSKLDKIIRQSLTRRRLACPPLKIWIGSLYSLKMSTTLTVLALMINSTVNVLVTAY